MKKNLFYFLLFFLFVSCGRNYPQMVNERMEKYQNEGKYILAHSNDSSGAEHYVVYLDNNNIVVDDLVDTLKVYPLGKLKSFDFGLYNGNSAGNDSIDFGENDNSISCNVQADTATCTMVISPAYDVWAEKIIAFKDIRCCSQYSAYIDDGKQTIIFFFDRPGEIYWSFNEMVSVEKNDAGFALHFHAKANELGLYSLSECNLGFEKCSYTMQITDYSEIIKVDDNITIAGSHKIPISAFGTPQLLSYCSKIVSSLHPVYYWNCQNCGRVARSEIKPKDTVCDFFTKNAYWTFHRWVKLAAVGSCIYQCQKCGVQIHTDGVPKTGTCPQDGQHVWGRLQ